MTDPFSSIASSIETALAPERETFRRRLGGLRRRRQQGKPFDRGINKLQQEIERSASRRQFRQRHLPQPDFPESLPVSARRAEIAAAIEKHQVVVIAGETGSGKTTQLPKICMQIGRGVDGLIGHTQPRRLAARSVANRIASELNSDLGKQVGFKIRFTDHSSADTYLRVMTDGILLAEIQHDPLLRHYDTIIIDEAHERSLNIDFLLGYLKQLLPRRPDLKLIITSATINTEAFSAFFDNAPVIEVSGRTYPVEVRYRPLLAEDEDDRDRDLPQAICEAVDELGRDNPLGDVLVFLPGEREIREVTEALRKHRLRDTELLPLFSRLSAAEQDRVFGSHAGRRIVLATNVAETSLTVPGIRFVIDTGIARISRYSHRTKVQRLPIEAISQASANQRAGRCGRVAPGICIRLYSEQEFEERPAFTDPEIRRTNLASVILQMANLGLGDILAFPFIDPPDSRFVTDGYRLLHEIEAVGNKNHLTPVGRQLVKLPVDPRIGRMLITADRERCLEEVLIIASALSIQDPRDRPVEAQQQADEQHRRFKDESSDFLSFVQLWNHFHEQARHLSKSKLRKLCHAEFLSYIRMREWHDIHGQLVQVARELGLRPNKEPAEYDAIHRSLLSGLLSHIGFRQEEEERRTPGKKGKRKTLPTFQGARGSTFQIFPGSHLKKSPPKWMMSAELVETSQLFARTNAAIKPEWLEELGRHLVKRSYSEAHWEKRPAKVAAFEQVSLFGLVIIPKRKINYGPIDPVLSRDLFIRHALIRGEYVTRAKLIRENWALMEELEAIEAKSRRRDVLVDEETLFAFYDDRLPAGIVSGAHFESWFKQAPKEQQEQLRLSREALMQSGAGGVSEEQFPNSISIDGMHLALDYHFEPGQSQDGVTVIVPLPALERLTTHRFEWLVPGLLEEKVVALIRGLPKSLRRNFVPATNFASALMPNLAFANGSLPEMLSHQLLRMTGVEVPLEQWRAVEMPPHLAMNYRIIDGNGRTLISGRDLDTLKQEMAGQVKEHLDETPAPSNSMEREGLLNWPDEPIPERLETQRQGLTFCAYPALQDDGDSVSLRLFESEQTARQAMWAGCRRLLLLALADKIKAARKAIPNEQRLGLLYSRFGNSQGLQRELVDASADRLLAQHSPLPRDAAGFAAVVEQGKKTFISLFQRLAEEALASLEEERALQQQLKRPIVPECIGFAAQIKAHAESLVYAGFVTATPDPWLARLPLYLKALQQQLDKAQRNPGQERTLAHERSGLMKKFFDKYDNMQFPAPEWVQFRWLLEELFISLYAQELKTVESISVKRLERLWNELP